MTKTSFKAILFDKDGTIFDSETMYCESWVESAKEFGAHFTTEMYNQFVGVRAEECYNIAEKLFGDDFPMDEFKVFNRQWINHQKSLGVPFKKGFKAFFARVVEQKLPIGLVTSSVYDATLLSFEPYPDYVNKFLFMVTGDQVSQPKPSPEGYLKACQKLNLAPEQVLVFEDSTAGITAGLAAGCQVAAIPDYLPISTELLAKCNYVFESFEDALFLVS